MCVSRIFLPNCVLLLLGREPGHPERRDGTTKIRIVEFDGEVSMGREISAPLFPPLLSLFRNGEKKEYISCNCIPMRREKKGREKSERLMDRKLSIFRRFRDRWWIRFHPIRLDFRRVSGTLHETLRKSGQVFEEAGGRLAVGGRSTRRKEATGSDPAR